MVCLNLREIVHVSLWGHLGTVHFGARAFVKNGMSCKISASVHTMMMLKVELSPPVIYYTDRSKAVLLFLFVCLFV